MNQVDVGARCLCPQRKDRVIGIDSDILRRWFFVPHDSAAAEMRLNVDIVARHQVDDVLVGLAFSAWISHAYIIVKSADDVNIIGGFAIKSGKYSASPSASPKMT
jgi:hypothetical protein